MGVWYARLATGLMLIAAKAAFGYTCSTETSDTLIQPQAMSVQRDLPVGSLIAQVKTDAVTTYKCSNTAPYLIYQGRGIRALGTYVGNFDGKRVYKTNVEGIGYAIGIRAISAARDCGDREINWVDGSSMFYPDRTFYCEGNGFLGSQMRAMAAINFYKTAQTTSTGSISVGRVGTFFQMNDYEYQRPESTISIGSFNVNAVSCTAGSKLITVRLGNIPIGAVKGPGSSPSSTLTKAFSIPLTCSKGASINLQLDGTAHDAAQGLLKLNTEASSATGVAIQLLYDDKPVELAKRIRWHTADADGNYAIPLKARYVQTGTSITPGIANGSATFTLTYQ